MPQCVVIADDLTGANATGVLLKKMNYKAYTVMNAERLALSTLSQCDCVLYPTDSRGVDSEIAYNRVYNVCSLLQNPDVKVYGKRIDSTLRGNLGSETDAMLDCLGEEYVAIVAPCFPSSGRIVVGGYLLVHGIPLHKTDIAIDPKTPVTVSQVKELFQQQSKHKVSTLYLEDLMLGKEYLVEKIQEHIKEGSRILTFDCITQEDLDLIADAVLDCDKKIVAIDPGVFTATLARKCIAVSKTEGQRKILAAVGSVNPNTKAQMEELWLSQSTNSVLVQTKELLEGEVQREQEISRVVSAILSECHDYVISTVTGDGIYPENRLDFEPYMERYGCSMDEISEKINGAFGEIAYRIFQEEKAFRGLYTSGGDVTIAVCKKFSVAGIDLIDEVLPLAAYGQMIKGEFPDVHIITKGGSQGGRDAITRCMSYLKEKLLV